MPGPVVQPAPSARLLLEAQFGYAVYDEEEESSEGEMGEDRFIGGVQHLCIDNRSFS